MRGLVERSLALLLVAVTLIAPLAVLSGIASAADQAIYEANFETGAQGWTSTEYGGGSCNGGATVVPSPYLGDGNLFRMDCSPPGGQVNSPQLPDPAIYPDRMTYSFDWGFNANSGFGGGVQGGIYRMRFDCFSDGSCSGTGLRILLTRTSVDGGGNPVFSYTLSTSSGNAPAVTGLQGGRIDGVPISHHFELNWNKVAQTISLSEGGVETVTAFPIGAADVTRYAVFEIVPPAGTGYTLDVDNAVIAIPGTIGGGGGTTTSLFNNIKLVFESCSVVTLTDSRTEAANGVTWSWDWGDGTGETTTVPTASHAYISRDVYTLVVRVADRSGRIDTFAGPVDLKGPACVIQPFARLLGPYILSTLVISALALLVQGARRRYTFITRVFAAVVIVSAVIVAVFIWYGWIPELPGGISLA